MKAITLHAPWAYPIFHLGKNVINRSWEPPKDLIGERILLHSGMQFDEDASLNLFENQNNNACQMKKDLSSKKLLNLYKTLIDYPRGYLVGSAVLASVLTPDTVQEDWVQGPFCWILKDVVEFSHPIPHKGQMKLWNVNLDSILENIRI